LICKRKNHSDKSTHKMPWQTDCIDRKTVHQTTQRIEEKGRLKFLYIQGNQKK